jgi:TolA-binding protein
MNVFLKNDLKNIFVIATVGIFMIAFVLSFPSCKGEEVVEGEVPVDERIPQLEAKVEELEQDVSAKDAQIAQLEETAADLENQVPSAHDVQQGDNHWQVAYDFLTQEEDLPEMEAKSYLAKAPLFHPLLVGFTVWNYYHDNVYGTFITQGSAPVSQKYLIRKEEQKQREEKMDLEEKIREMTGKNEDLRDDVQKLEQEKETLNAQITMREQKIKECQNINEDLNARLNSLYFIADTKDNLESRGIIKGTFLGLGGMNIDEVSAADFGNNINLDAKDFVELKAEDYGIDQIKKVSLLPKHLDENEDYRVEISANKREAKVHILDAEKFRLARIILCLN